MLEEDAAGTRPRLNPSSSGVLAEGEAGCGSHSPTVKIILTVVTSSFLVCSLDLFLLNKSLGLLIICFGTFDCRTRSSNYSKLEKYVGEKVSSRTRNSILIKEIRK